MRFTTKRPGMYSSSSVTSSPRRLRRPPQSAQRSPGVRCVSSRGRWSGRGRRLGCLLAAGTGSATASAARAISSSSSPSSSWSRASEVAPKRWRRQTRKLVLELLDQKVTVAQLGVPRRQLGP